jgi:hypothetical protein
VGDGNTETDHESGAQEHVVVRTNGLQNDSDQHDAAADEDTHATAEDVRTVWHEWDGANGTGSHDSVQDTQSSLGRVAEVIFPGRKCLKTVHHGAIISAKRRVSLELVIYIKSRALAYPLVALVSTTNMRMI